MSWYLLYGLLVLLSAMAAVLLAAFSWRHRSTPGAGPAFVGYVALAIWAPSYILMLVSGDLPSAMFWRSLQIASVVFVPLAWLGVMLQFTRHQEWLKRSRLVALGVIPSITIALLITNGWHGWVARDVRFDMVGPLAVLTVIPGPWFWVHVAYSYLVGLVNFVLLAGALLHAPLVQRRQLLTIAIGVALPVGGSILDVLDVGPFGKLEVSPVLLGLGGLVMAWGLFRYRLFDLVPIARHRVVDGLTDGVVVLNHRNQIVDLNPAALEIFECSPSEAIGRKAEDVLWSCAELLDLTRQSMYVRVEFFCVDGKQRHYEGQATPLIDRAGRVLGRVITLRDITERRLIENALRASEQRYRDLADSLPETVFETDLRGRLTFANVSGLEKFGVTKEQFEAGVNFVEYIAPDDRERAAANFAMMLGGGASEAREYTALKSDGTPFPVVIASRRAMRDDQPIGLRGFIVDITERKKFEAKLLDQQRSLAVLEERDRLARELHDGLGQVLGYVNTQAQAIRELLSIGQTAVADAHLARLVSVAQDAYADVREYILSLKDSASSQPNLLPSLEEYLRRFGQSNAITTELVVPEELREGALAPLVEAQLKRIVQEALSNVRKHACASNVRVAFSVANDAQVQVVIEDDGRGFDPDEIGRLGPQSFGLRIMRERAQEVGATVQVISEPGRGTEIIVRAPMRRAERRVLYEDLVSR